MELNRFGLSRYMPSSVKKEVRRKNGFGCVICGKAIFEYEHISPPFKDAEKHDVEGITLLCPEHHAKKTRGHLSVATIMKHMENPRAKQNGFSHEAFDIGIEFPEIVIGDFSGTQVTSIIAMNGHRLISISPPEQLGQPFILNAHICDQAGVPILEIVDNEWRTSSENWDVEVTGSRLSIRSAYRSIAIVLRVDPPNRLVFERLQLTHKGASIYADEIGLVVTLPNGYQMKMQGSYCHGCDIGIDITNQYIGIGKGGGFTHIGSIST